MADSLSKAKLSGRNLAAVVLVSVLIFLNILSYVNVIIHGSQFFGQELLFNISTILNMLSLFSYGAVILLTLRGKQHIATIFLIPTILSTVFLYAGYASVDLGPEYYLPFISLTTFNPDWWAGSILIGLEIPAVIAVALLLLMPNKNSNDLNQKPGHYEATGVPMEKANYCPGCGASAGDGDFCSKCGKQLTGSVVSVNQAAALNPTTNTMAVVAFILSFFVPIVGLILGYISRKEIDNSQGRFTGRGLATAAIVLNWIWIIFIIIWGVGVGIAASQYSSY